MTIKLEIFPLSERRNHVDWSGSSAQEQNFLNTFHLMASAFGDDLRRGHFEDLRAETRGILAGHEGALRDLDRILGLWEKDREARSQGEQRQKPPVGRGSNSKPRPEIHPLILARQAAYLDKLSLEDLEQKTAQLQRETSYHAGPTPEHEFPHKEYEGAGEIFELENTERKPAHLDEKTGQPKSGSFHFQDRVASPVVYYSHPPSSELEGDDHGWDMVEEAYQVPDDAQDDDVDSWTVLTEEDNYMDVYHL